MHKVLLISGLLWLSATALAQGPITGFMPAQRYYVEAWVAWFHTFNPGADVRISGGQGADWLRAGGTLYVPLVFQFGIFAGAGHVFRVGISGAPRA